MTGVSAAELFAGELVERTARRVVELIGDRLGPTAEATSPWMTVGEAAVYLRCKPKRVYDLVSQCRIPVHREGSRLLFHRVELDAYVLAGDDDLDTLLTRNGNGR